MACCAGSREDLALCWQLGWVKKQLYTNYRVKETQLYACHRVMWKSGSVSVSGLHGVPALYPLRGRVEAQLFASHRVMWKPGSMSATESHGYPSSEPAMRKNGNLALCRLQGFVKTCLIPRKSGSEQVEILVILVRGEFYWVVATYFLLNPPKNVCLCRRIYKEKFETLYTFKFLYNVWWLLKYKSWHFVWWLME